MLINLPPSRPAMNSGPVRLICPGSQLTLLGKGVQIIMRTIRLVAIHSILWIPDSPINNSSREGTDWEEIVTSIGMDGWPSPEPAIKTINHIVDMLRTLPCLPISFIDRPYSIHWSGRPSYEQTSLRGKDTAAVAYQVTQPSGQPTLCGDATGHASINHSNPNQWGHGPDGANSIHSNLFNLQLKRRC